MSQAYFHMDNTEGYTQEQLAELNRRYEQRLSAITEEQFEATQAKFGSASAADKAIRDWIADSVQTAYDTELSAAPKTEDAWATAAIRDERP